MLFLRPQRHRQGKLGGRFAKGLFLGRVDRTNEVMVGAGNQLVRTTKFLRLPQEQQWSADAVDGLRGLLLWRLGRPGATTEPLLQLDLSLLRTPGRRGQTRRRRKSGST